jgi:hypothetical protein
VWNSDGDEYECNVTGERMTIFNVKTWLHDRLNAHPPVESLELIVEPGPDKYVAEDRDTVMPLVREGKPLRWVLVPDQYSTLFNGANRWRDADGKPVAPQDYPLWLACGQDGRTFTTTKNRRAGRH